jgi:ubiquinol-cytochrome c reductase cytochrome c subunit
MTPAAPRRRRWRVLLWYLPLIAIAPLGTLIVSSGHARATEISPPGPSNPALLYDQECAVCHGATGRGTPRAPSLVGVGMADVDFQLTTGRMPKRSAAHKQPPYRAVLSQADIQALDTFVTALVAHGGPGIPSVDPAAGDLGQGQELFSENCAACHGWGGRGGELVDRPVPSIAEATPTQVAEAIRSGPDQMPIFGTDALTPTEVNDVTAYVMSLKHPDDRGGDPLSYIGPLASGAVAIIVGLVGILGIVRWIGQRG